MNDEEYTQMFLDIEAASQRMKKQPVKKTQRELEAFLESLTLLSRQYGIILSGWDDGLSATNEQLSAQSVLISWDTKNSRGYIVEDDHVYPPNEWIES